ncbi:MAG: AlkZ-related protein [Terriglobales bacterium]
MTEQELHDARRSKWRLDGRPVRTLEEAREFLETVGFCLMYPMKPPVLAPTFMGAFAGTDENPLPTSKHAFADPRAREATELMVRMLREKTAFEANAFGDTSFLVAAPLFPYLYGLVGDRHPRREWKPGVKSEYSQLAREAFEAIRNHGKTSKKQLQELMGGALSEAALDRALNELWSRLRITRVDYTAGEGASWDALYRWAPQPVQRGINLSVQEALSALLSKYLDAVVAAEPSEAEGFFGRLVPKSRVKEAINALLAARELAFVTVGKRTMVQVAAKRETTLKVPRRRA